MGRLTRTKYQQPKKGHAGSSGGRCCLKTELLLGQQVNQHLLRLQDRNYNYRLMTGGYMEFCKVKKIRITLVENTNNLRLLGKQCVGR